MVEYAREARRDGRQLLDRATHECDSPIQTRLLETWPVDFALTQLASDYGATVLVLASSHRGSLGSIVPGGVASRLVRRAPCPIAVAPLGYAANDGGPISQLGVAYDGSSDSNLALQAAARSAAGLDVPVRLYHVIYPIAASAAIRAQMRETADDVLSAGLKRLPAEVEASTSVVDEAAADSIAEATREDNVGLLYVGSRGYGPLREAAVGGFVGALLKTATCPVVIVAHSARLPAA